MVPTICNKEFWVPIFRLNNNSTWWDTFTVIFWATDLPLARDRWIQLTMFISITVLPTLTSSSARQLINSAILEKKLGSKDSTQGLLGAKHKCYLSARRLLLLFWFSKNIKDEQSSTLKKLSWAFFFFPSNIDIKTTFLMVRQWTTLAEWVQMDFNLLNALKNYKLAMYVIETN